MRKKIIFNFVQALFWIGSLIFLPVIIAAQSDFLPPEQAFPLSSEVQDAETIRLIFSPPSGYYLYREKISFSSETKAITLGAAVIPTGELKEDEFFGSVHTLHGLTEITIPINNPTGVKRLLLNVSSQGCADAGLCYPPLNRILEIDLPITETQKEIKSPPMQSVSASSAPIKSESERLATIIASGDLLLLISVFFGIGLLLAFTPCVFPMIPILSGIIAGQGALNTRKAFFLSLIYVLAMAITYAGAGIVAGLFGKNLQATFQNPVIIAGFIGVFILLALSMFGFYELQIPSALQTRLSELSNRQRGGNWLGVALMGILSALIVGPCVAPPLAAAFLYIGRTGDGLIGGAALFSLALGMGTPLLIIGTAAGKFLPRAGAWMNAIKAVFGVGLLGVAIILLERIVPAIIVMAAWGILLIISAVYLGATRASRAEDSGWSHFSQGIGLILLIYGALILIGVAAGNRDLFQPLRGAFSGALPAAQLQFRRIKTVADVEREINAAVIQKRPVMLDFYADWCIACKEMERDIFTNPEVIAAISGIITLQADITANDEQDQELLGYFEIPGPPAMIFFDANGQERTANRIIGSINTQEFLAHLRAIISE